VQVFAVVMQSLMSAVNVVVMALLVLNLLQIYFSLSTLKAQVIINILKYIMLQIQMLVWMVINL
jgi:hypothetical protein